MRKFNILVLMFFCLILLINPNFTSAEDWDVTNWQEFSDAYTGAQTADEIHIQNDIIFSGALNAGAWDVLTINSADASNKTLAGNALAGFNIVDRTLTFSNLTFQNFKGAVSISASGAETNFLGTLNFIANNSNQNGAAINIKEGAQLSAGGAALNFTSNKSNGFGGAIYASGDAAQISIDFTGASFIFDNNQALRGGALYIENTGTQDINFYDADLTFTNNSAQFGGAIYFENVEINFDAQNLIFTKNSADQEGGAIYAAGTEITISPKQDTLFSQNTAAKKPNDIFLNGSVLNLAATGISLTLEGGIKAVNESEVNFETTNSGEISLQGINEFRNTILNFPNDSNSHLTIENSSFNYISNSHLEMQNLNLYFANSTVNFISNSSYEIPLETGGGAIYFDESNISFSNITLNFVSNKTIDNGNGGAIFIAASNQYPVFTNAKLNFVSNDAGGGNGGAVYAEFFGFNFSNSAMLFDKNNANEGGAIAFDPNLQNNISGLSLTFTNNTAAHYGGAIYVEGGTLTFSNTPLEFRSNSAGQEGGAIYLNGGALTFTNTRLEFRANSAAQAGGAIYISDGELSFDTNVPITFLQNQAAGNSNDIYADQGVLNLRADNTTITLASGVDLENYSVFKWEFSGSGLLVLGGKNIFRQMDSLTLQEGAAINIINSNFLYTSNENAFEASRQTKINFSGGMHEFSNNPNAALVLRENSNVNFSGLQFLFNQNNPEQYSTDQKGGAIYLDSNSALNFNNSNGDFTKNSVAQNGGAIYISQNSILRFNNTQAIFADNSAGEKGGAIYNEGTLILQSASNGRIVFLNNTDADNNPNDIFNSGKINITGGEILIKSGITGDENNTVNIEGGTLKINSQNVSINTLNIGSGGKFSLVNENNGNAQNGFDFLASSVSISNLTIAGTLEISINLENASGDKIDVLDSMTVLPGANFSVIPYGAWRGQENIKIMKTNSQSGASFVYDTYHYELISQDDYLILSVIRNPYIARPPDPLEGISGHFLASIIREFANNSFIADENIKKAIWAQAAYGKNKIKADEEIFGIFGPEFLAGAKIVSFDKTFLGAFINYKSLTAAGGGEKARITDERFGIYANSDLELINLQLNFSYGLGHVLAQNTDSRAEFDLTTFGFGVQALLNRDLLFENLKPFLALSGANVKNEKIDNYNISQKGSEIGANNYLKLELMTGLSFNKTFDHFNVSAKPYFAFTLMGANAEYEVNVLYERRKKVSAIKDDLWSFGLDLRGETKIYKNLGIFIGTDIKRNLAKFAYQINGGINFEF